jgi:hypothetical protein
MRVPQQLLWNHNIANFTGTNSDEIVTPLFASGRSRQPAVPCRPTAPDFIDSGAGITNGTADQAR